MYWARWPAILRKKSLSRCQLWIVRWVPHCEGVNILIMKGGLGRTYDEVSMCCIAHQLRREAISWALEHTERFAEDEVTHDVEDQPFTPMCCVPLGIPAFFRDTAVCLSSQHLTSYPHVCKNVLFQALDCVITKGMTHDSPLTCMLHLVDSRVHANGLWRARECFIEACFSDIATETVDGFQAGRSVY
jgi:hypothetical protein